MCGWNIICSRRTLRDGGIVLNVMGGRGGVWEFGIIKISSYEKNCGDRFFGNEVEELRSEKRELGVKLLELTLREQIFWAQKAKVRWLKEGDVSSKFFHRIADGKRKKKFIKRLEVRRGIVVDSEEQIVQGIFEFYSNLFSKDGLVRPGIEVLEWKPIDQESATWLERPFEELEIRDVVFECERDKALGSDGDGAIRIEDFRPISLVTSLYKILGKVLSKRLRASLGDTISPTQGAFVKGRQILDVVLVVNEVVKECRKAGNRGLVFKADFEKAYNHVDWNFLDFVMDKKGYGER
ncbi:uncharacterized protein LOC114297658 [Camellia sinensis]|uniref:uncharacterized protein LOC114297658 n=1 Tax=Camellia sinensis TaxID=4442 RepID=UPI001035FC04|nr:uncharacterized protein LOC114297658 [Camellia sinensis]